MMHVVFVVVGAADSLAMVTFAPVEVDVHSCLVEHKTKAIKMFEKLCASQDVW